MAQAGQVFESSFLALSCGQAGVMIHTGQATKEIPGRPGSLFIACAALRVS